MALSVFAAGDGWSGKRRACRGGIEFRRAAVLRHALFSALERRRGRSAEPQCFEPRPTA